jgi:hypothetical protein
MQKISTLTKDINVIMTMPVGANATFVAEGIAGVPMRIGEHGGKRVITTAWKLTPDQLTLLIENGGVFEIHLMTKDMVPVAVQIAG